MCIMLNHVNICTHTIQKFGIAWNKYFRLSNPEFIWLKYSEKSNIV